MRQAGRQAEKGLELSVWDDYVVAVVVDAGRMHRSNHIMMVADLRRGWLVQRCHDPECRHYR